MYVCVCHQVTEGEIMEAVSAGCRSLEDLGDVLQVATNCGLCEPAAEEILNVRARLQGPTGPTY